MKNSIRTKIILLSIGMVAIAIVGISGLYYNRFSDTLLETATKGLAGENRLIALEVERTFDEMQTDAFLMAQTPAVRGIIQSTENRQKGTVLFNDDTELWNRQLQSIFSSILTSRDHYMQIRFIGVADRGKELVRVERSEMGLQIIDPEQLQEKEGEPYVKMGLQLGKNDIAFSEITYNREHGEIDPRYLLMLRVVTPVFNDIGEHFGLIVINVNFELLVEHMLQHIAPSEHTIIASHAGDYMSYLEDGTVTKMEKHGRYTSQPPAYLSRIIELQNGEGYFTTTENVISYVKFNADPQNQRTAISVILSVSQAELFADVFQTRKDTLILGFGLLVAAVVLTGFVANQLMAPLKKMTRDILQLEQGNFALTLPTQLNDEVGNLARAFKGLMEDLQSSEAKAHAVLENVVDGIINIDEDGTVTAYNRACIQLFGYFPEEVMGQNIKMLMPEPVHSAHDGYLMQYRQNGKKSIIGKGREVVGQRKDGTTFPLHLSVAEIYVKEQHMFTGILRDITELKQAEIQREIWIERLAQSNKELEQFAYIASHDLQEPLRKIQAYSERLRRYQDVMDEKGQTYLERMELSVIRMRTLIQDLLNLSRVSHNELEWVQADVTAIVQEAVANLETVIEESNASVEIEDTITIEADPRQLRQLFQNLLGNALKFHKEGEAPQVRVFGKHLDGGYYEICVEDNGIGFDEKYLDRIFQPFERLHGRSEYSGTGIGMAICKKIVDRHNGSITAHSRPDKGATFIVRLPVRQSTAQSMIPQVT